MAAALPAQLVEDHGKEPCALCVMALGVGFAVPEFGRQGSARDQRLGTTVAVGALRAVLPGAALWVAVPGPGRDASDGHEQAVTWARSEGLEPPSF